MEHSPKDVELSIKVKQASYLARQKKFDEAISALNEVIDVLLEYDLDHSAICVKIIPYFQKAGRFSEVESYVSSKLIPIGTRVRKKAFSHQNRYIQEAFSHLLLSQIFDKVRLSAKREKISNLETYYAKKSRDEYKDYLNALKLGEAQNKKEKED